MEIKYQIGQQAWRATWDSSESWITCPDCGGTGRIRCLLHDDTMISVECERCRHGYNPPTGTIKVYDRKPHAVVVTVTGFEAARDKIEYRTNDSYIVPADQLFDDEMAALNKAREIAAEADREERKRVAEKEKPTRSWSWNVHYHRKCIREAKRQIEYHTAKLNVAAIKAKEPA